MNCTMNYNTILIELLRLDYHLRITEDFLEFDCQLHTNMSSHMYTVHYPTDTPPCVQHCATTRMTRFLEDSVYSSSLRDQERYNTQVGERRQQFDAYNYPYYTPNPLSTPQEKEIQKETTIKGMECSAGWAKDPVTKKEIRPTIDEEYMLFTCDDEKVKEEYVFTPYKENIPEEVQKENEGTLQRLKRTILSSSLSISLHPISLYPSYA